MVSHISHDSFPLTARPRGLRRFAELLYLAAEHVILALVPRRGPGPFFRLKEVYEHFKEPLSWL